MRNERGEGEMAGGVVVEGRLGDRKVVNVGVKHYLCTAKMHGRPVRLSVRTRDFHSLKRSSTLLRATRGE